MIGGFPSPDSDYNCRFVYVRRQIDHLTLEPARDVLEFPVEGLVDTGGWDSAKALKFAVFGIVFVAAWTRSPIVYDIVRRLRGQLSPALQKVAATEVVANNHRGLLNCQHDR